MTVIILKKISDFFTELEVLTELIYQLEKLGNSIKIEMYSENKEGYILYIREYPIRYLQKTRLYVERDKQDWNTENKERIKEYFLHNETERFKIYNENAIITRKVLRALAHKEIPNIYRLNSELQNNWKEYLYKQAKSKIKEYILVINDKANNISTTHTNIINIINKIKENVQEEIHTELRDAHIRDNEIFKRAKMMSQQDKILTQEEIE